MTYFEDGLKVNEVAEKMRVSEGTVRNWIRAGLKHVKVGGIIFIRPGDVEKFMKGQNENEDHELPKQS